MTELPRSHRDAVWVACAPGVLYDLVSDVPRTGEWSPVCRECWWDEGDGPRRGARFTGRNVTAERTWTTRSQVVDAEPGRAFSWVVGEGYVRWGYLLEPEDGGTRLTETWEFLPAGLAVFAERYGADAEAQIADRTRAALQGIPATLAAVKAVAEG